MQDVAIAPEEIEKHGEECDSHRMVAARQPMHHKQEQDVSSMARSGIAAEGSLGAEEQEQKKQQGGKESIERIGFCINSLKPDCVREAGEKAGKRPHKKAGGR